MVVESRNGLEPPGCENLLPILSTRLQQLGFSMRGKSLFERRRVCPKGKGGGDGESSQNQQGPNADTAEEMYPRLRLPGFPALLVPRD